MRTSVSAKRCPACGKITPLHAQECEACGHRFRTHFEETLNQTQAFDAVMLPRPPVLPPPSTPPRTGGLSTFALAFLGSFCLMAVVGLTTWLFWSFGQGSVAPVPRPATYASSAPSGRAENLYERIGISMSLYDVDQAAGGMGRVVRSTNPHRLLLSYDYPDQSVRVSLYRSNLTGDDYRVQAVALYHGNILLHRHVDDN